MTLKEILNENTDELLSLIVVAPTIGVIGFQSIVGSDITMITEPAMLVLGYYFGRKIVKSE